MKIKKISWLGAGMALASVLAVSGSITASAPAQAPLPHSVGGPMKWVPGSPPANGPVNQATRTLNWAGYAAIRRSGSTYQYTSVASSWVQPSVWCYNRTTQYGAFWVGLDGYYSQTVEQTGVLAECYNRTAYFIPWYEMYPGPMVAVNHTVRPGDHMRAATTYKGRGWYALTLADSTRHWTWSTTQYMTGAQRSSAEVIAEAPASASTGSILPLADFNHVNFTSSDVGSGYLGKSYDTTIIMPWMSVSGIHSQQNFTVNYHFNSHW